MRNWKHYKVYIIILAISPNRDRRLLSCMTMTLAFIIQNKISWFGWITKCWISIRVVSRPYFYIIILIFPFSFFLYKFSELLSKIKIFVFTPNIVNRLILNILPFSAWLYSVKKSRYCIGFLVRIREINRFITQNYAVLSSPRLLRIFENRFHSVIIHSDVIVWKLKWVCVEISWSKFWRKGVIFRT
jgi:hypothetical protein